MTEKENEDQRGWVACLRHRARTENLIMIDLFPKPLPLAMVTMGRVLCEGWYNMVARLPASTADELRDFGPVTKLLCPSDSLK